jgi:hypothetical protein
MRLQHQGPIHYLQLLTQNLWEEAILRVGDYALLHIWQPNNVNYHYYGIQYYTLLIKTMNYELPIIPSMDEVLVVEQLQIVG